MPDQLKIFDSTFVQQLRTTITQSLHNEIKDSDTQKMTIALIALFKLFSRNRIRRRFQLQEITCKRYVVILPLSESDRNKINANRKSKNVIGNTSYVRKTLIQVGSAKNWVANYIRSLMKKALPEDYLLIFTIFPNDVGIPLKEFLQNTFEDQIYISILSCKEPNVNILIDIFKKSKQKMKVMIAGLKSGGVGLNLQFINKVIFMDTDWNPMWYDQALGRVLRRGQINNIESYQLINDEPLEIFQFTKCLVCLNCRRLNC